ncbi:MAG: PDZ domain-containing protein [Woeseia sp.]|nr:PDZ domain-containing protein [Woeseia sp.]MBT8097564.1 PDZ domain-containing protein [Woeseia sp.]NNL55733.1 PDZ domain-containing protein [Woeseia sp.]
MAISLLQCAVPLAAADEAWFGIQVKAEGEGRFWNPVINELIVVDVEANSPAAKAGISKGDRIVEVFGQAIVGERMRKLVPFFEKTVGETLRLTLVNEAGDRISVTLIGENRPAEKQ